MCSLIDICKISIFICLTDTSGNVAVVCQGVLKAVAYHHILGRYGVLLGLDQEIIRHLKGMGSIIIICIDHHKRSVDLSGTA